MKKITAILLTGILVLSIAIGCTKELTENTNPSTTAPSTSTGTPEPTDETLNGHIVMYTADPQEIITEALDAFVAKNPDVTYELFRSGTGNLTTKLAAEFEAGGSPCNVFSLADFAFLKKMDSQNLIYRWTPKNAENLADESYKVDGDLGYNYHIEACVIVYNTTLVKDPPKDWFDLTKPEYKGMVAFADPGYSGAAFSTLVTHINNSDVTGWKLYEDMKANNLKFEQSNGNLQSKIAAGEYSAVVLLDYMARNAKTSGSPVEVVYPESGSVMIYAPVCIMNTVKDKDLPTVKAFVEFLISDDGQAIYSKYNYLPVTKTGATPAGAPNPTDIKVLPLSIDFFVENNESIRAQYEKLFNK